MWIFIPKLRILIPNVRILIPKLRILIPKVWISKFERLRRVIFPCNSIYFYYLSIPSCIWWQCPYDIVHIDGRWSICSNNPLLSLFLNIFCTHLFSFDVPMVYYQWKTRILVLETWGSNDLWSKTLFPLGLDISLWTCW